MKAYKVMLGGAGVDSLVCTVWRNVAPPKVELMVWLALLEKLNTKDLLVRKGLFPSQVNLCSFCDRQQEDIDHLLLSCQFSWSIWCSIASDFEVQLARQHSFRHFYEVWMSWRSHNPIRKKLFMLAFFAVAWCLWTQRNKIVFEQQELDAKALQLIIRWRIAVWSKA